jgi:alpha-galactosidase
MTPRKSPGRCAVAFIAISIFVSRAALAQSIHIDTSNFHIALNVSNGQIAQAAFGKTSSSRSRRSQLFYPAAGDGYVWEPALMAVHADGNTSTDLEFVRVTQQSIDSDRSETRIDLKDPQYPFYVTLCFRAFHDEDVISQWTEIHHDEPGTVTLERFASSSPMIAGSPIFLTQYHGSWAHEMNPVQEELTNGTKILDSKLGVRADYYQHPSFILSQGGPPREESGEVLGGTLAWSGSFQFAFEIADGHLRAICGMNPFDSSYRLAANQILVTPAMLWSYSAEGSGPMSRNFHRWARKYTLRDGDVPRPVLLNNWEATHFDFTQAKLVSLFDGAKEIGAETFLLDDGWFGNNHPRNNDRAGLGDWQVNSSKLRNGIGYLTDQAQKRGLQFGIWVEPEMVNPASDLFTAHPDWVIRQPKRAFSDLASNRNQLVLDLTRPEVRDFVYKTVDDLLSSNPGIKFVKWDCNRYVTQPGSTYLKASDQQNLWIDYGYALYDIMDRTAAHHPDVRMMLCSGGGGRVDYGALRYFDEFWPSDNTDPLARVKIQWGYSQFFPACAMADHVTRSGNRPLKFAADVAMSGNLGIDMDLSGCSAAERKTLANAVAAYKQIREIVACGDLYRLESPFDGPRAALMYVTPDQSKAVLYVYQLSDAQSATVVIARGLKADRHYRVTELDLPEGQASKLAENGNVIDGSVLQTTGLIPPFQHAFDSTVIELSDEPAVR